MTVKFNEQIENNQIILPYNNSLIQYNNTLFTNKNLDRRKNNWAIIANDDNSIMLIKLINIQKNNYEFKKLNIINITNNEIITEVTELTNKIENCKIYKTGKIKINKKDNQIIWKIPYLELVHSIPNQTKWFDIFKPIPSELNNTIQIEPYDMVQIKTTIKNNDTLSTTLNIQKMIQRNFTHKPIECFYISKHHNHNKNSSNISFAWLIPTIMPMPFHGKAYNYCSPNRAEAECIKHILVTTPSNQHIIIYTKNENTKKIINNQKINLKTQNYHVWSSIIKIIINKELKIEIKKFNTKLGEQKEIYNILKNTMENKNTKLIENNTNETQNLPAILWHDHIISIYPRTFIKQLLLIKHTINWIKQKGIIGTFKEPLTWKYFKPKEYKINNCQENQRIELFTIKAITKNLPTMNILNKRRSDIYLTNICTRCKIKKETIKHILFCSKTQQTYKANFINNIDKIIKLHYSNKATLNTKTNLITQLTDNTDLKRLIFSLSMKIITQTNYKKIKKIFNNKTNKIITQLIEQLNHEFYNEWKERNKNLIEWENKRKITKIEKRKKTTNIVGIGSISTTSHTNNNDNLENIKKIQDQAIHNWFIKGWSRHKTI